MEQLQQIKFDDFVLLMRQLVAEEIGFEEFKKQYWKIYNNIEEEQITDRTAFDEVYEMMYMGENDPVAKEDKKYGFVGHKEIKERIAALLSTSNK